jgi:NTP pyrophosphatase (non-canonical NTP hydrolase)
MDLQKATEDALRTETADGYAGAISRLQDPNVIRLLHGAVGMVTEIGEFMDVLKKFIFYGKPLDRVNLHEEGGDMSWYLRIIAEGLKDVAGGECSLEVMIKRNVEKLRVRFPNAFEEGLAINRDHTKERPVLEGKK